MQFNPPRAGGEALTFFCRKKSKCLPAGRQENPVAASAASEVSGLAWLVQTAPAEAKRKRNGDTVVWP